MQTIILSKEEKYTKMVDDIALALSRNSRVDSETIYKIAEALQEGRPNKSKRFAFVGFLKDCGLV